MDSLVDSGSPVIISSAKTTHFDDFDPFAPQAISSTSSMSFHHESSQNNFSDNFDLLDDFVESHGGGKSDIKFNHAIKYEEDDTRDDMDREGDNDDDYLYTVPPANECSVHEVHYTPEELAMYNNDEEDEQDENGLDLNEAMVEDSQSSHLNEKEAELFYSTQYENVRSGQANQLNNNNNDSIIVSSFDCFESSMTRSQDTSHNVPASNHIDYQDTNGVTGRSLVELDDNQQRTVTIISNVTRNHKNVNNYNEVYSNTEFPQGMENRINFHNAPQVFEDDEGYSNVNFNQKLEQQSKLNDAKLNINTNNQFKNEVSIVPKLLNGEGERKKLSELKREELEEYSPPTKPRHTSSTSSNENKAASQISVYAALGENMCKKCEKRVYEMEKITVDNVVFHKTCFRCVICKRMLSLGNYSTNEGLMYCKPDFLKSFKERGNYAFGKEVKSNAIENIDHDNHVEMNHRNAYEGFVEHDSEYMNSEYPIKPEEMPSVELKSVRSMFEKKADNSSVPFKKPSETNSQSNHINNQSLQSYDMTTNPLTIYINQNHLPGGPASDSVREEELPPPAITKNVRAIFERGQAVDLNTSNTKPLKSTPEPSRHSVRMETIVLPTTTVSPNVHSHTPVPVALQHSPADGNHTEDQADELPQVGTTRSLLAQWRNIEVNVDSRRGRSEKKSSPAIRSQSLSRIEYMNRLQSREHIPIARSPSKTDEDLGDSEAARATRARLAKYKEIALNEQRENDASKPKEANTTKSFKWQVKEPTPMNRGVLIVHGDVPRHQTSAMSPPIQQYMPDNDPTYATIDDLSPPPRHDGYIQHDVISPEEMPDPKNIRSALQRFKALEDPNKAPPLPVVIGDKTKKKKVPTATLR